MTGSFRWTRLFIPTGTLLGAVLLLTGLAIPSVQAVVPTPTQPAVAIPTSPPPTPFPTPTVTPTPLPTPTPPVTSRPAERLAPLDEAPVPTPIVLPDSAEVPILMYHYVEDLPTNADGIRRDLTVTPEMFEAHLQFLTEAGYETITLTDLFLHLTQGLPLPEKPVILTFDDGYRDAYTVVFPLLQEYGFTGTFFVLATPAHFESPQYLTWAMMDEMAEAGMEIQGHGRDHIDMRGLSYDYLVYQLLGIKEAVEYHTGEPVVFFCYPSGQYDDDVINVLKSAGYWGAVTTEYGRVHTREDLFVLDRIRIRGTDSLAAFIARMEGR